MKALDKRAADVLDALTAGLAVGDARKFDDGPYMAVHVDRLSEKTFSVAHYFEQNGDLVPDPDGVFLRTPEGWLPVSLQLCTGMYTQAIELDGYDRPTGWNRRAYPGVVSFMAMWLRNIREQQGGLDAILLAAKRAA